MTSPIIEIDLLVKEYEPGRRAVDGLSLQVFPGEIFGFLGPNGAGKTSTLKILTTLSKPTSGRAIVAGHDVVTQANAVRASIGYVGQQPGVDMALTGRENLVLQGHLFHLSKEEIANRVEELFALFDLSESADWRVMGYSGGMKRKLDIAMALIHRPKILFLDEPSLGLDPQSRSALWSHIKRVNKEHQMTIFLTTHYLDEADRLSHRLAIIDRGKIQGIGTSDALKDTLAGDGIHLTFEEEVGSAELAGIRESGKGEGWVIRELIQEGKEIHLYLENAKAALPRLLQILEQVKVPVRTVALSRPTLDDVFLKYTGHSMGKGEEASSGGNPWWPGGGGGDWKKWQKKSQKNGKEGEAAEKPSDEGTAKQVQWAGKEWPNEWSKQGEDGSQKGSDPKTAGEETPAWPNAWSKEGDSKKEGGGEADWKKWGGKS